MILYFEVCKKIFFFQYEKYFLFTEIPNFVFRLLISMSNMCNISNKKYYEIAYLTVSQISI